MWMIDPKLLCSKHLIGEHGEIHKHLPSFRKGYKIDGRFDPVVQIQLNRLKERHDELAVEMFARKYRHISPLLDIPNLKEKYPQHYDKMVDLNISKTDLYQRCFACEGRKDA